MTKKIGVLENLIVKDPKSCLRGKRERGKENNIQEWRAWQTNLGEIEHGDKKEFWAEL